MRHKLAVLVFVLALFAGGDMVNFEEKAHAGTSFSFGLFYDSLSPYGSWVPINGYGYGWSPTQAGPDWQPYMDGQWVWSDQGWTWASAEPWGWATYHYGRWIYDSYYGWTWIPGTTWAPAYVSWYQSPGYVGWSPLPPDNNFFIEIGINFFNYNSGYYGGYNNNYYGGNYGHHHHHHGQYYDNDYYAPGNHCVFVPQDKFTNKNARLVALDREHNLTVMRNVKNVTNIKVENNRIYNYGPDKSAIERAGNGKITPVHLVDSDLSALRAGKNGNGLDRNNFNVFRPSITKQADESPVNRPGTINRGIQNARDVKGTGINNSRASQNRDMGNGLVQQRSVKTDTGTPYGNTAPNNYGIQKRNTGTLNSGANTLDTSKRGEINGNAYGPADRPVNSGRMPATVPVGKSNPYSSPNGNDYQGRTRSNTLVNNRVKQNQNPVAEPGPAYGNPYNNRVPNTVTNRYKNPGSRQPLNRAPVQPGNSYNPNRYNAQNQAPRYTQTRQKPGNVSNDRGPSYTDNSPQMNTSPQQFRSPSVNTGNTGMRSYSPGSTRSFNNNSLVRNSGRR